MALPELTLPLASDECDTLEDRADGTAHAMLFHFDPRTKNIVSHAFDIDPALVRPGVPDWVTHYHAFPEPVRRALEGLYAMANRAEGYRR